MGEVTRGSGGHKKRVTIVVPIYADWASLSKCLDSLIMHVVDPHEVLLVNDCGPDVDKLEKDILKKIAGQQKFRYERNPQNLGFVKTCNRAVYELDVSNNDILLLNSDTVVTAGFLEEMLEILYLTDRHGVVIPRSNNATLATVPLRLLSMQRSDDIEYGYQVFNAVKDLLPRYSVVPTGIGFCMLIRRQIVKNFGLFDEAYGLGYHEENDFCMRINRYGYSPVMANRAFVYHLESRSFSPEVKRVQNEKNEKLLVRRNPYYPLLLERYFEQFIDPIDHFADAVAGLIAKKKILLNFFHFPTAFIGTTKSGHSFLKFLSAHRPASQYDISILTTPEAERFHNLKRYGFRVLFPNDLREEIFDVGYCPGQFFHMENLLMMNKYCLRIAYSLLDIITVRSNYLLANNIKLRAIFLDSLRLADRVITISEFSKKDVLDYYGPQAAEYRHKLIPIRMGYPGKTFETINAGAHLTELLKGRTGEFMRSKQGYILVLGNDYHHKAINEILPVIGKSEHQYILLGPKPRENQPDNIAIVPSGNISDDNMAALIQGASLLLFPSQYEGFGFPILEAGRHGKPLLYFGSEVGDEIAVLVRRKVPTDKFRLFAEIPEKITALLQKSEGKASAKQYDVRTIDDYNHEVFAVLMDLAKESAVDAAALRERWTYFATMREYYYSGTPSPKLTFQMRLAMLNTMRTRFPRLYGSLKSTYRRYRAR